jgi:hypothetical protein
MRPMGVFILWMMAVASVAQTPRLRINSFLEGSGSISVRVWSPSTGYDQTMNYQLGVAYQNQNPMLPSPPSGDDYSILVTNLSNRNVL